MEHYLIKKKVVESVDIGELSIGELARLNDAGNSILYITDKGKYIGCISGMEYDKSLKCKEVVINRNSIFLTADGKELDRARKIFDERPFIRGIPVLGYEGELLYEYVCDREGFYEALKLDCGLNREEIRRHKLVVSLTSYGKRLETVYIAVKSIMYQTKKADEIVLYLDSDSGNCRIKYEEELVQAGLTIKRNVENLKPHNKYYYAMEEFEDADIITIDDDIIYDDKLIEDLYLKHLEYPDTIICRRGHKMTSSGFNLSPYNDWEGCVTSVCPSEDICPTGVGGVLYPYGSYRKLFLNREAILNYALTADDLWLKVIELLNGIKAYAIGTLPLKYVKETQKDSLQVLNVNQRQNDIVLAQLQKYFSVNLAELISNAALPDDGR